MEFALELTGASACSAAYERDAAAWVEAASEASASLEVATQLAGRIIAAAAPEPWGMAP